MIINPFLFITPRDKSDELIGRFDFFEKIKKTVLESLDESAIVTIKGDFGIGKSLFVKKAMEDLSAKKNLKIFYLDFNLNTLNDLRNMPSEKEIGKQIIVIIDRFELMLSLSNTLQEKIVKLMADLCEAKVTLIITASDDLMVKMAKMDAKLKNYFKVLNVPPISLAEAKKLVISRLDEVRKNNKGTIKPFNENEIEKIHRNAKGNPRIILMLLASLYEDYENRMQ
jgi:6-pyruvoyl-tetrahydropterin synthase